jgi:predicted metallopeptidase
MSKFERAPRFIRRVRSKKLKNKKFSWEEAEDIKKRGLQLIESLHLDYLLAERIFFYRSDGSKSRAYARTWGLPKLWQDALNVEPAYIIEVISHYFDNLPHREQDKILLHELTHIPKNFSGALVPHTRRRKGSFHHKLEELIDKYFENNDNL